MIATEVFGHDVKRFCEYIRYCRLPTETVLDENPIPTVTLTSTEICGRALNHERNGWNTTEDAAFYVQSAKETGEQIDTCRLKLGLPTIAQQSQEDERGRLRALTNQILCTNALPADNSRFSYLTQSLPYTEEAVRRGLSPEECMALLDRVDANKGNVENTKKSNEFENSRNPTESYGQVIGPSVSVIRNPASQISNMRSGPGTQYGVVARLPNGIEVTILGVSMSASGYAWCRVSLTNGKTGFVFARSVQNSCASAQQQENVTIIQTPPPNLQETLDTTKQLIDVLKRLK